MFIKNWDNPPSELRSKLFWAWNDHLEAEQLTAQIDRMRAMGLGGFYIHSRNGLKTPYLGSQWFELVNHALKTAAANGIYGEFYDEDRWPSGAAGGSIAAQFPELAASTLRRKQASTAPENTLLSVGDAGKCWHYYVEKHAKTDWFNNSCYPDVFNPETAQRFLESTHEKYLTRCGRNIGRYTGEFFMDEPFYGLECFRFGQALPWTPRLPELYMEKFGEDLIAQLPALFTDQPDDSHIKIRWQFHGLLSSLFRENFLLPIAQWCEKHNFKLTGHLFGEDMISSQNGSHGSNMAALHCFQKPGIDYLTAQRRHPATVKQLSSVAHQLGRKERLAEIYGCTGWEFTLYDQRKQSDMLFALGVNRLCLHLGWYSAAGERKRDFPGSLAWHSAAVDEYSRLEDRTGRLHAVFDSCSEVRNILLLDPVESGYTLMQEDYENSFVFDALENSRTAVIDTLLNANLDFDFADEELLAQYGKVENSSLTVAKAAYHAVILPETVTLRQSTWELLEKFTAAGGRLFIAGNAPRYINGRPADRTLAGKICTPQELPENLSFCRTVSITGTDNEEVPGLLHLLMRHDKGHFLFIHNPGYSAAQQSDATNWQGCAAIDRRRSCSDIAVKLTGFSGNAQLWDADDGMISAAPEKLALASGDSILLYFPDEAEMLAEKAAFEPVQVENSTFKIQLNEPNILLFDRAEAADKHGVFHAPVDMRRLDAQFRKHNALPPRQLPRRQPWAEPEAAEAFPVTLRFSFFCDEVPPNEVLFAAEDGDAGVFCNGEKLSRTQFCWFDHSLKFFAVPRLQPGLNQIVMHTSIDFHRTLENCFLLGDFGVKISGFDLHVTAPVRELAFGNWGDQGLPFYSGAVDYRLSVPPGRNRKLDLKLKCSYAAILENTDRFWHEKDDLALPDEIGQITLRLYGSRRNSHGPFHVVQQLRYCNPSSFSPLREEFHPHWQLEEYGIFNDTNSGGDI